MLQRVVRSTIIDAPIERVWAVLRDFNSHDHWHNVVDSSRIEGEERSDQVGCIRSFTLKDGNRIREQLLKLDDHQHKSTYCIVDATVPLNRYVATIAPFGIGNQPSARRLEGSVSCATWFLRAYMKLVSRIFAATWLRAAICSYRAPATWRCRGLCRFTAVAS